jgi:hypothetical protein
MNIFRLLRQLRLYALAQRLVPFPLPASERELRRWDALGEAYTALLEIKYADNLQSARELAASSADRVRESCRQRRQGTNIPGGETHNPCHDCHSPHDSEAL